MNKRTIDGVSTTSLSPTHEWLNVEGLAEVEITSEHPSHPIESAVLAGRGSGWRAAGPGRQTIRMIFTHPQALRRIWLHFHEPEVERTQEYVLRWSSDHGQSFQEIVRQQWNFSPLGSTNETEDHHLDLQAVTLLELSIIPDISQGNAFASLAQLRLA
ncbi:MAG: carbohydrate-binding protein [Nitrospira sp.]